MLALPVDAFAFRAGEGTVCEAYEQGYFKGSDGYYYGFPITDGNAWGIYEYVVFDDSGNGTYYSAAYDVDNTSTIQLRGKLMEMKMMISTAEAEVFNKPVL